MTKDTLLQLDKDRGPIYSDISSIEVDVSNLDKSYFSGLARKSVGKSFNSSGPRIIFLFMLLIPLLL